MPSEILEQIREQVAFFERTHPLEDPSERRERELKKRKAEEARKMREAEDKQLATANSWESWFAAIDQRIKQWWGAEGELLKDGIGGALGTIRKQVRDEFKHAIDTFEAKLAALEGRQD